MFEIEKFRIQDMSLGSQSPQIPEVVPAVPRHAPGELFIKGPIPFDWMKAASRVGGYRVEAICLLIWFKAGFPNSHPVKLTRHLLASFKINPKTAKNTLLGMQSAGLVSCEFQRGRSPLVTILSYQPSAPEGVS